MESTTPSNDNLERSADVETRSPRRDEIRDEEPRDTRHARPECPPPIRDEANAVNETEELDSGDI